MKSKSAILRCRDVLVPIQTVLLVVVLLTINYNSKAVSTQCVGDISEKSYLALEDLYYAANGDDWFWNETNPADSQEWSFPSSVSDPCSSLPWYGLTCAVSTVDNNKEACTITEMKLVRFHMVGSLPSSIGNLTGLEVLSLPENVLRSSIPPEIGQLSRLQSLQLSVNRLTNTIPTQLWTLKKLVNISLDVNRLTGTLPVDIAELQSLQILTLFANFLHGELPDTIGVLASLRTLDVDGNRFFGQLPTTLGLLTSLTVLQADANLFGGTLPTELGLLSRLEVLQLDDNQIKGPIPTELLSLGSLQVLDLYVNQLTGTLATEIGLMTSIYYLSLNSNGLEGELPTELGLLTLLTYLSLNNNAFVGPLPTELCILPLLSTAELEANFFSQSLPTEIGLLSSVSELLLYHNNFTGQIPREISQLNSLRVLDIETNSFSGLIPTELGLLTNLQQLNFGLNKLVGPIPSQLGLLTNLTLFAVNGNSLTGTVPSQLGLITTLTQLDLSTNSLNGTLPVELSSLLSMLVFNLAENAFTGHVVDFFAKFSELTNLLLSANAFSGPLPDQFGNFSSMQYLQLDTNFYSGSIPSLYFQAPLIQTISISENLLSGAVPAVTPTLFRAELISIHSNLLTSSLPAVVGPLLKAYMVGNNFFSGLLPSDIAQNINLESLLLSSNYLSGSLPLDYGNLLRLQVLNVSRNNLHGVLTELFENASSLRRLEELDLSQNDFSGPIPDSLFTSQSNRSKFLKEVALYSNCFTGSVPPHICDSKLLSTVVLDALNTGSSCRRKFKGPIHTLVKAVVSIHPLSGTIPSCLWQMPSLQTLHLSGNSLEGSLGDLVNGSTILRDVSLASNKLVGSIPESWQTWGKFVQLDLSSNRFSGTLSDSFVVNANNSNLDLTVNRLSGGVPSTFRQVENINVLNGNLFQCDGETVPVNDPSSNSYVCGASDFNIALAVWSVLGVIVMGYMAINFAALRTWLENYDAFLLILCRPRQDCHVELGIVRFMGMMKKACHLNSILAVAYVIVVMIVYVLLKAIPTLSKLYSTHSEQYTWITTVVYLHGIAPTSFALVALLLSVTWMGCMLGRPVGGPTTSDWKPTLGRCREILKPVRTANYSLLISVFLVLLVHVTVTVIVNVAYVYALIAGQATAALLTLQFGLSLFKLSWNNIFVPFALRNIFLSRDGAFLCSSFMMLFTFLVSPLVATFFSDTTCFRYIVTSQPSVSSSFFTSEFACSPACATTANNNVECHTFCRYTERAEEEVFTSVTPSWLYSFQCASSVITNYVPVLVMAYGISGLLVPLLYMAQFRIPREIMDKYTPKRLHDRWIRNTIYSHCEDTLHCSPEVRGNEEAIVCGTASKSADLCILQHPPTPLFNAVSILSKLSLDVAVTLTFGLASPLLTIVVATDSIFVLVRFRLLLQRYMSLNFPVAESSSGQNLPNNVSDDFGVQRLEQATAGVLNGLPSVVLLIALTAGCFWGFFVFDMIGDVYGADLGAGMLGATVGGVLSVHFVISWLINMRTASTQGSSVSSPSVKQSVSHDIRNPLVSVQRSYSEMAMNAPFEKVQDRNYDL
jgi:Leucine-rich repeat (LRR) protein